PGFPLVTDKGANTYDPDTIYATDGTKVYVTKDHGQSWVTRSVSGVSNGIVDLEVDPRQRNTVYAVRAEQGGGKVFRSNDAGQTWTDITQNLPDVPAWKLVIDPRTNDLYVGNDNGVYILPGGVGPWQRFGVGLPNVQVRDLDLNQNLNILT